MSLLSDAVSADPSRVEEVALAIAADEYPRLNLDGWRGRLDRLAEPLAQRIAAAPSDPAKLEALCSHLYRELGFVGSDDYDDPRCSFLNDVVERRTGSPVALAVLLIAVGRRVGVLLDGVGFPGHFLVRTRAEPAVLIDPFDGGYPLSRDSLIELAQQTLSCDEREARARLEPVGPRTVAIRMLQNLQRIYRARGDHARSMVVHDRLFELTQAPFHRCDRGAHALAAGAVRLAIADLEAYLAACPDAQDASTVRQLLGRLRRLPLPPSS